MAQGLRALVVLGEDGFNSQNQHSGSQPSVTPFPGESSVFWLPWALRECNALTYMQAEIHTHKTKIHLF